MEDARFEDRDDLEERRRGRLTPAGRQLLDEIERMLDANEDPPFEEIVARIKALPPADQTELFSMFVARGYAAEGRAEAHARKAETWGSASEIIQAARELDRAAGRPANENMTLREALEKLGY